MPCVVIHFPPGFDGKPCADTSDTKRVKKTKKRAISHPCDRAKQNRGKEISIANILFDITSTLFLFLRVVGLHKLKINA